MNAKDLRNQIKKQCGFNDQQGETPKTRRGEAKPEFPTIAEQEQYWRDRDADLDRTESNCFFYDETLRDAGRNEDGSGESYAERNQ